ncbi:MAG: glucose-6-phosphate isomerase [Deltaproteobacteria bacterium]|nr:glucose-6-phosphate isomerase [Deltaproteobacteria bacterium]
MIGGKDYVAFLGPYQLKVEEGFKEIEEQKIIARIWSHDYTVWKPDPEEITNRLGWLHSPKTMLEEVPRIRNFVNDVQKENYRNVLLMGMGGSSLAPEVYRSIFGVKEGYLDLAVLDSTDPGAVLDKKELAGKEKTLFVVSTKSGGTAETLSFMKYFYNFVAARDGLKNAGKSFLAITDPGSNLESIAKALGFREVFLNDPNIGGRYSALSFFGMVPAGLIGMELETLLENAGKVASSLEKSSKLGRKDMAAWLGVAMGKLASMGRDKLTLVISPSVSAFGAWLAQLIAESTGKEGKGILPVYGETLAPPSAYAKDRFFVYLRLDGDGAHDQGIRAIAEAGMPVVQINILDPYELGSQIFIWEIATAIAGKVLGINPFDQPNVESSKALTRELIARFRKEGKLPEPEITFRSDNISVYTDTKTENLAQALSSFMNKANPGKGEALGRSYVAIQAYLKPSEENYSLLRKLRTKLQLAYRMATTLGFGPRFLHSMGQLYKGDAGHGLFIQITGDMPVDLPIPDEPGKEESSISFGVLKMAQALGDRQALIDRGRKVIRFHLETDTVAGLKKLIEAVG